MKLNVWLWFCGQRSPCLKRLILKWLGFEQERDERVDEMAQPKEEFVSTIVLANQSHLPHQLQSPHQQQECYLLVRVLKPAMKVVVVVLVFEGIQRTTCVIPPRHSYP